MKSTIVTVGIAMVLVIGFYFGKRLYLKPGIENGIRASEINGTLLDGSEFSLSSLRGKYVLLDFWGSWCKPCRESHPELVQLYEEFNARPFDEASGFEVVSYGVEQRADRWKEAIEMDRLSWPFHLVSEDLFNSPVVKAYNVKQIPTKFLIDPVGVIIAVDPTIEEVRKILVNR